MELSRAIELTREFGAIPALSPLERCEIDGCYMPRFHVLLVVLPDEMKRLTLCELHYRLVGFGDIAAEAELVAISEDEARRRRMESIIDDEPPF